MSLVTFVGERRHGALRACAERYPTPFVVIDLDVVRERYNQLREAFPETGIYYAVKANPAPEVIALLRDLGSSFDIASRYELDRVLSLGVAPSRVSYGNTIKKAVDVEYFYSRGVRLFATDSEADLKNIAERAPGSKVYARILVDGGNSADWPLSRKFGCVPEYAIKLLKQARDLGLEPVGVSFHVGSQQRDVTAYTRALAQVRDVFAALKDAGITLSIVNLGGGFPGRYAGTEAPALAAYAKTIHAGMAEFFPGQNVSTFLEPGRSLLADAGVLVTEVVLISRKSETEDKRWVYLDVGKFSGLIETMDEAIRYAIFSDRDGGETEGAIMAGPTCDSADILYERKPYPLPKALEMGDRLYIASTGAYTTSYSAVEFNGFPPLKAYYIDSAENSWQHHVVELAKAV